MFTFLLAFNFVLKNGSSHTCYKTMMMIMIKTFMSVYYVPDIILRVHNSHNSLNPLSHLVRWVLSLCSFHRWKKLRQRTIKHLAQGHKASKWHSWDLKPGHLTLAARIFTCMLDVGWLYILYLGGIWNCPSDKLYNTVILAI